MPVYRNETEYFWGQIENNTEYYKFPEMYKLLNDRTCEEFYHLCKNFIDIALNAPKFPNKENLTVEACFQYSDMDKAKRATQDFISKFNIQNVEELLTVEQNQEHYLKMLLMVLQILEYISIFVESQMKYGTNL